METTPIIGPAIRLRITADTLRSWAPPSLLDCSRFLVDLNLTYEIARLVSDPAYRDHTFSPAVFSRSGKRLFPADRIWIRSLSLNSPLEINALIVPAIGAIPALWAMVQAIDKVRNWGLDSAKRQTDAQIARRDLRLRDLQIEKTELEVQALRRSQAPLEVLPQQPHPDRRPDRELPNVDLKKAKRDLGEIASSVNGAQNVPMPSLDENNYSPEDNRAIERTTERLRESPIVVTDVDIDYIKRLER